MNPTIAAVSPKNQECDEIIWNAFRNNNMEAFTVIYYRFFAVLLQKGLQISSNRELVKDCIHDLFVEIWKNKRNLSTPVSVRAYLIASIQRKILRQLKKLPSQEAEMKSFPIEIVFSKEDQLISEQIIEDQRYRVNHALNTLTKRQKEAIHLKFYANLSYNEIAGLMKINTDSIYNLISKAITVLQEGMYKKNEPKLF